MAIDGIASLAAELQQLTRGRVMLTSLGASADKLLTLQVPSSLAQQFVDRLTKPLQVEYEDGNDYRTWTNSRNETPTEAALSVIRTTVSQLQRKLMRVGACLEESAGMLHIEGSMLLLVLVDGTFENFRALSEITRTSAGVTYPLFEPKELAPEPGNCLELVNGEFVQL